MQELMPFFESFRKQQYGNQYKNVTLSVSLGSTPPSMGGYVLLPLQKYSVNGVH